MNVARAEGAGRLRREYFAKGERAGPGCLPHLAPAPFIFQQILHGAPGV